VDNGEGSTSKKNIPELDVDFGISSGQDGFDEEGSDIEADPLDKVDEDNTTLPPSAELIPPKGRKAPAWTDLDDTTLQVSLASDKRLRKLRDAPSDDAIGGREYERRLRRQYEKINPTPSWASNARKKLHSATSKRARSSTSSGSEAEDESEDIFPELLSSTGGLLGATKFKALPQGTLAIERLRDANQAAQSEGEIKALQFHPSPQVPVLMTASADRRVRLFNVCAFNRRKMMFLNSIRLMVTRIHIYKLCIFPLSHSPLLISIPRALPFYLQVPVPFTTHTTCSQVRHNVRLGAYGEQPSIIRTRKLRI